VTRRAGPGRLDRSASIVMFIVVSRLSRITVIENACFDRGFQPGPLGGRVLRHGPDQHALLHTEVFRKLSVESFSFDPEHGRAPGRKRPWNVRDPDFRNADFRTHRCPGEHLAAFVLLDRRRKRLGGPAARDRQFYGTTGRGLPDQTCKLFDALDNCAAIVENDVAFHDSRAFGRRIVRHRSNLDPALFFQLELAGAL
jgi:hypothetical protein